ncbi:hypothetical protein BDV19DRAFT_359231 [Aspergillus venezuelensis]
MMKGTLGTGTGRALYTLSSACMQVSCSCLVLPRQLDYSSRRLPTSPLLCHPFILQYHALCPPTPEAAPSCPPASTVHSGERIQLRACGSPLQSGVDAVLADTNHTLQ